MCNRTNNEGESCIANILSVILVLQENACPENCLDTCDRPVLGSGPNCVICNTRPVMLFTCNGTPVSMPVSREEGNCDEPGTRCSSVFRVEKLDGNCCTFRVLKEKERHEDDCNPKFVATDSFFTMNLDCCCIVRCLNDTFVECV